jgi:RimJ/RimL family protein N-acetyltransferase
VLEAAHAAIIYRGINQPDTYEYLNSTLPKGLSFEEAWLERMQTPSEKQLVVGICTEADELIGTMGLHNIDLINRVAETGSVIFAEQHRNQGYATDAKMVLLEYAFNYLGLYIVTSRAIGFNGRSAAYSKKCGYVEEARLRSRIFRNGERHDEIILSVTREEWLPLWEAYQVS